MSRTVPIGIPFTHPFVFKDELPKTAVDDSPGSSLLGLSTTPGVKLVTNAASGNTKTDRCGVLIVVPPNWVEGSTIVFRARAKQATTLLTVGTTLSVTAKLQGDDTVGSDIASLAAVARRTLTIAFANYDVARIPGTTLRRGDHVWCRFTVSLDDSGGTVNTAAHVSRLWAVMALES